MFPTVWKRAKRVACEYWDPMCARYLRMIRLAIHDRAMAHVEELILHDQGWTAVRVGGYRETLPAIFPAVGDGVEYFLRHSFRRSEGPRPLRIVYLSPATADS